MLQRIQCFSCCFNCPEFFASCLTFLYPIRPCDMMQFMVCSFLDVLSGAASCLFAHIAPHDLLGEHCLSGSCMNIIDGVWIDLFPLKSATRPSCTTTSLSRDTHFSAVGLALMTYNYKYRGSVNFGHFQLRSMEESRLPHFLFL